MSDTRAGAPATQTARQQLEAMAHGFFRGKVLVAAVRLGVADALRDGSATLDELSSATGADRASLHRLLRAMASMGVLEETATERYALAPLGRPLCRDAVDGVHATVQFWGDLLADQWNYLPECVRTGSLTRAREEIARQHQKPRMAADPARTAALFHGCFAETPAESHEGFARAYDFSSSRLVADLGGGGGGLLVSILTAHPHLRGVLVDQEGAIGGATQRIGAAGLAERCTVRVGDLFQGVPAEPDTYLIKHVLHIFGDDRAAEMLARCRDAMSSTDRLLVLEHVLPERIERADPELESVLMLDLNMLAVTGGGERSEPQWLALLEEAGFAMRRVIPVEGTRVRIVEAVRAD